MFALVVMAQLKTKLLTDGDARALAKIKLVRLLFERNYRREQIQQLFHVIDRMLQLPSGLAPLSTSGLRRKCPRSTPLNATALRKVFCKDVRKAAWKLSEKPRLT